MRSDMVASRDTRGLRSSFLDRCSSVCEENLLDTMTWTITSGGSLGESSCNFSYPVIHVALYTAIKFILDRWQSSVCRNLGPVMTYISPTRGKPPDPGSGTQPDAELGKPQNSPQAQSKSLRYSQHADPLTSIKQPMELSLQQRKPIQDLQAC